MNIKQLKKTKRNYFWLTSVPKMGTLITVVAIILITLLYNFLQNTYLTIQNHTKYLDRSDSQVIAIPTISDYQTSQQIDREGKITLKRKVFDEWQDVYVFRPGFQNEIEKWRNNLVYRAADANSQTSLNIHDLATGENVIIFPTSDSDRAENAGKYIKHMRVRGDNLFFTAAMPYGGGGPTTLYHIDLNNPARTSILDVMQDARLEEIGGYIWFIGSNGPSGGCGGSEQYKLLKHDGQVSLSPGPTSNSGCIAGNSFVGVSDGLSVIMAYHSNDNHPSTNWSAGGIVVYESVISIQLDKASDEVDLISKDDMPKEVTHIVHANDLRKLVLANSEKIFIFDMTSRSMENSLSIPTGTNTNSIDYLGGGLLCVSDQSGSVVNLSTMKVTEGNEHCENAFDRQKQQSAFQWQKMIEDLDLPSEYALFINE